MFPRMKPRKTPCNQELSAANLAHMAKVLRLLAHPLRLRIIDLLEDEGHAPVHWLMEKLRLSQAVTSNHLKVMRRVGLVECERHGKEIWYSVGDRRSLSILNCMRSKKGA